MQRLALMLHGGRSPALALLRVVLGGVVGLAGYRKVVQGDLAVSALRELGLPWPELLGPVLSLLELGGGVLLAVGLCTRLLGLWFAGEFLVATVVIAGIDGWMGARLESLLAAGAWVLATHGAGAWKLDRPHHPWEP